MPVNIANPGAVPVHRAWMRLMRTYVFGTARAIREQRNARARMRRAAR